MDAQEHRTAAEQWLQVARDWYEQGGTNDVTAGILAASLADIHFKLAADRGLPTSKPVPVTDAEITVAATKVCLSALDGADSIHLSITLAPNDPYSRVMVMPTVRTLEQLEAVAAALGTTPRITHRSDGRTEYAVASGAVSAWWIEPKDKPVTPELVSADVA